MARSFPWYDSYWLASYLATRDLIRASDPAREAEFTAAFEPLRTNPQFRTVEIPDVLGPKVLAELRRLIAGLASEALEKHEFLRFGRHVVHDHPYLSQVQADIKSLVSEHAGERVESSYNFLSLYNNLGVCELHLDAPNAKWTLDVCIDQSMPWPIGISEVCDWPEDMDCSPGWEQRVRADPKVKFKEYRHVEGSGLLFSGSSQWHFRNRISRGGQQNFSHLAFFHFFPAGARDLVNPRQWPRFFGIPRIADVIAIPKTQAVAHYPMGEDRR